MELLYDIKYDAFLVIIGVCVQMRFACIRYLRWLIPGYLAFAAMESGSIAMAEADSMQLVFTAVLAVGAILSAAMAFREKKKGPSSGVSVFHKAGPSKNAGAAGGKPQPAEHADVRQDKGGKRPAAAAGNFWQRLAAAKSDGPSQKTRRPEHAASGSGIDHTSCDACCGTGSRLPASSVERPRGKREMPVHRRTDYHSPYTDPDSMDKNDLREFL